MLWGLIVSAIVTGFITCQPGTPSQPATTPAPAPPAAAASPADADLSSLTMDELIKRLPPAGQEWSWDRAAGMGKEDPASEEMERRLVTAKLTDEQWRAVLIDTGALRFRPRWPRDTEYAVSMTVPRWLGITQIRLSPRVEGMSEASAGELLMGFSGTVPMMRARDARMGQPMGKVPPGTREIVFDVEVERGEGMNLFDDEKKAPPKGMLWKGVITTPVELVESFAHALPEAKGDGLDAAVRDAIGAGIREWGPTLKKFPFVLIDPDCAKYPELATTGLDIKVELMEGEQVLAQASLVAMDTDTVALSSSLSKARSRYFGSANLKPPGEIDTTGWKLRFTGQSEHVWLLWDAKQRWAGVITIPWDDAVQHEAQRVGVEGRGPEASTPYFK